MTTGLFAIPATLASVYYVFGTSSPPRARAEWVVLIGVVDQLLILALISYILKLRGLTYDSFTEPARKRDLVPTFGLLVAHVVLFYAALYVVWTHARSWLDPAEGSIHDLMRTAGAGWPYLIFALVNPFGEEILVRGWLQSRLREADCGAVLTVAVSVLIQGAYHLYQGVGAAVCHTVAFLAFAIYYQRTRRLWPVVGAHLILDVLWVLQSV